MDRQPVQVAGLSVAYLVRSHNEKSSLTFSDYGSVVDTY